jgi:hypothetical protein
MDEEGIMALGPGSMDQGPMPEENTLSYNEAYNATKNAVREFHPEISSQYEMGMDEILAELGNLTVEELDALRQLVEYVEKNRDRYPEVMAELVAQDIIDEGDFPPEYDEQFMAVLRAAIEEASLRGKAMEIPQVQQFADGGLASLAAQGRFGDTMLAHITPTEAAMLKAMGGSGTINPMTGLPEFFFKKIFRAIKRVVKGVVKGVKKVLSSPIGRIVGTIALTPFVGPVAAGAIVGGITGGVKGAILGGIGGYVSGAGFTDDILGSGIGKSLVGALGQTGAKFAIQTATGTALGLAGGAKLGDAIKGGVAGAALQYAMGKTLGAGRKPGEAPAPIQERGIGGLGSTAPSQAPGGISPGIPLPPREAIVGTPLGPTGPAAPGFAPAQQILTQGAMPTSSVAATNPAVQQGVANAFADAAEAMPLTSQINRAAASATPTISPMTPSAPNFQVQAPKVPGVLGGGAGAETATAPTQPDFGFDRLSREPFSYAKDVYNTYLSPSREGLSADAGIIEKYGPLTAVGLGAMYAGGGFEPQTMNAPSFEPGEGGQRFLNQAPNLFYVQNLPGVRYGSRGEIIGTEPYNRPLPSREDILVPTYNTGGIADIQAFPRRVGGISGPGTEKSDSIPAMLSDGEFVMTARAVRGMGNGSRRQGAKRMYKLMAMLEKNASKGA